MAVAARNASLNAVDVGELMEADALTALRGLRDQAQQYDLILLDPPKLANTERQLDKATRLQGPEPAGGEAAGPRGCAAHLVVQRRDEHGPVPEGGGRCRASMRNETCASSVACTNRATTQCPLAFPEAEHLKGLVLQADWTPPAVHLRADRLLLLDELDERAEAALGVMNATVVPLAARAWGLVDGSCTGGDHAGQRLGTVGHAIADVVH